jgi:hypothetical protein
VNLFLKCNFNTTQLVPYTWNTTPNKNKDKNNYNNNEDKQNTIKRENYLFMGVSIQFLQVEKEICHPDPPQRLNIHP